MSKFSNAVKSIEKKVIPGVKPVRVWTTEKDGTHTPWGDDDKYMDPDESKYQDYEIVYVGEDAAVIIE